MEEMDFEEMEEVQLVLEIQRPYPRTPRGSSPRNLIVIQTPEIISKDKSADSRSEVERLERVEGQLSQSDGCDRVNPFEKYYLENLACTMWSPSVFDNVRMDTPSPQPGSGFCGWDLHQMAELFPKEIETSPSSHMNPYPVDSYTEAKAQETIDKFFSSGPIVPTPEHVQVSKRNHKGLLLPKIQKPKVSSWTNTELSFPPVLPPELDEALAPFFQTTVIAGCEPQESRSDSSSNSRSSRPTKWMNNSVRRRLELSFGDSSSPRSPRTYVPYGDPFGDNHSMRSPELGCASSFNIEESAMELEARMKRTEDTPSAKRPAFRSPDITPIRNN